MRVILIAQKTKKPLYSRTVLGSSINVKAITIKR